MKEFEILQLVESKTLPTRSYRVPEKLMAALRQAGKELFGGNAEDSKLLFYFAAYGLRTWKMDQAGESGSHQDVYTSAFLKELQEKLDRERRKKAS